MKWRPINFAPRALGERILLAWPNKVVSIGWWATNPRLEKLDTVTLAEHGWQPNHFTYHNELDDYELSIAANQPTHWMPLPLLPGEKPKPKKPEKPQEPSWVLVYGKAREEHAYRLRREEGLTLVAIGKRLGVTRTRARHMVWYLRVRLVREIRKRTGDVPRQYAYQPSAHPEYLPSTKPQHLPPLDE